MDASVQIESVFTDGAERDVCDYEDGLVDVFKSGKGDGEFETKLFSEKCTASSASFSSSEEEDNAASSDNNNNAIGGDTDGREFGDIVPVENSKMPSDEQDVDIAERVKQGMPTLFPLSFTPSTAPAMF